jgi:ubiquinol-cytochrome c reductase cytochrome b subunit
VQINPVWLYGPYEAGSVTVPAQPDWYLWWVEGALRVVPAIDIVIGRYELPTQLFSGILLPVVAFGVLYAWPFVEERLTGDRSVQHLLDRPRDHPVRTAIGVAGLTGLVVLLAAASHDLQGLLLRIGIEAMTDAYRVALVVLPPLAGLVTWKLCRDVAARDRSTPAPDARR